MLEASPRRGAGLLEFHDPRREPEPEPPGRRSFGLGPIWVVLVPLALISAYRTLLTAPMSEYGQGQVMGALVGPLLLVWGPGWVAYRLAGRRRWAGRIVACLMVGLFAFGMLGEWASSRDAERSVIGIRAAGERFAREVERAARQGVAPPSLAEHLTDHARRLDSLSQSTQGVTAQGLAARAAFTAESAEVLAEYEAALNAQIELSDIRNAATLDRAIEAAERLRLTASRASDFESRAVERIRAHFVEQGLSGGDANAFLEGSTAGGYMPPGAFEDAFSAIETYAQTRLDALRQLREASADADGARFELRESASAQRLVETLRDHWSQMESNELVAVLRRPTEPTLEP